MNLQSKFDKVCRVAERIVNTLPLDEDYVDFDDRLGEAFQVLVDILSFVPEDSLDSFLVDPEEILRNMVVTPKKPHLTLLPGGLSE